MNEDKEIFEKIDAFAKKLREEQFTENGENPDLYAGRDVYWRHEPCDFCGAHEFIERGRYIAELDDENEENEDEEGRYTGGLARFCGDCLEKMEKKIEVHF